MVFLSIFNILFAFLTIILIRKYIFILIVFIKITIQVDIFILIKYKLTHMHVLDFHKVDKGVFEMF